MENGYGVSISPPNIFHTVMKLTSQLFLETIPRIVINGKKNIQMIFIICHMWFLKYYSSSLDDNNHL